MLDVKELNQEYWEARDRIEANIIELKNQIDKLEISKKQYQEAISALTIKIRDLGNNDVLAAARFETGIKVNQSEFKKLEEAISKVRANIDANKNELEAIDAKTAQEIYTLFVADDSPAVSTTATNSNTQSIAASSSATNSGTKPTIATSASSSSANQPKLRNSAAPTTPNASVQTTAKTSNTQPAAAASSATSNNSNQQNATNSTGAAEAPTVNQPLKPPKDNALKAKNGNGGNGYMALGIAVLCTVSLIGLVYASKKMDFICLKNMNLKGLLGSISNTFSR